MSVTDRTQPRTTLSTAASTPAALAEHPLPVGALRLSLAARAGLLMLTLVAEKSAVNLAVDFRSADAAHGLGAIFRVAQHFGFRFLVSFALALAFFVYVRRDPPLLQLDEDGRSAPLRPTWLALHVVSVIIGAAALYNLYGNHGIRLPFAALAGTSILFGAAAVVALALSLAPRQLWWRTASAIGMRWAYAACAAAVGTGAIVWSQGLWAPTAQLTFDLVRDLLSPVLPALQADASTRILRTPHFAVEVSSICSGLEGVGLMLAFCSAWLVYFRAEYRFPRALLIIPAGVLLVFALNVVRIAALVLIGNAGHPAIAIYGFHSEAGWIAFNCTACAVAFMSRRIDWLNRHAEPEAHPAATHPTAAYLLPLLAVLAAGMIARAGSSGFETWYALRLVAGLAALAIGWRTLTQLNWRFGWRAMATGGAVFALWLAASRLLQTQHGLPPPLAAMSAGPRGAWIASRVLTAALVIPIAQELAYRGYLMRRLLTESFESLPFGTVGWVPLLVAAAAFGVLHGAMWLPATAAGIAYGLLLIRTGRMGEAVAAHATAHLLIAAWVLTLGQWQLWQ